MTAQKRPRRSIWFALLPLAVFLALAGVFYKQLSSGGSSADVPSALIGRTAPSTDLEPLAGLMDGGEQVPAFTSKTLGKDYGLVNVWASWCGPCRQEHPILMELANRDDLKIIGLNYKDKRENALRFLGQLGNPYDAVGIDPNGRAAIEWGVYGVPETFLVDPSGKVVGKHIGPLTPEAVREKILDVIVREPQS